MTIHSRSPESGAPEVQSEHVLRTRGLLAEYTTGQAPSGEWFALGSVRAELPFVSPPAWVLVGTGASAEDAISGLLIELESEARRISR